MTRLFFTLAVLIGLTACEAPQERAFSTLADAAQDGRVSGAQSLVGTTDQPMRIFAEDVDETSRFRLASLSKLFTQVMILRLADQGELDLDQSLASLRPGLAADWASDVTLRQLLNFSSGLPRDLDNEIGGVRLDAAGGALTFMDAQGDISPETRPGTRTAYSNLGYMHLGAAIEEVTRLTYPEALEALVLRPAGLTETGFGIDRLGVDGHLHGYEGDPPSLVSDHPIAQRYSTGGLHGSVRDLERLSQHVLDSGFLSDAAREELFTQFGRPDARDPTYLLATGHVPGFTHAWLISRDPAFTIVSLNNRVSGDLRSVPEIATEAGAILNPAIASRTGRYRPIAADGWVAITGWGEIADHPILPNLTATLHAVLAGDLTASRNATMRLHGLDPSVASASNLGDFTDIAASYIQICADFGPFHPIAWRLDGDRLQIYLESEDDERGIHFAVEPAGTDPTITNSVSLGTYGFEP